jgi:hypothetical protein
MRSAGGSWRRNLPSMAWRIALLEGWLGALVGLVALDPNEATWYIAGGIPLTLLVGALVDRWWVTAAPYAVAAVIFAVVLIGGSTCRDCADEDGPALLTTILLATFAIPASAVLGAGVLFRRLPRSSRGQRA